MNASLFCNLETQVMLQVSFWCNIWWPCCYLFLLSLIIESEPVRFNNIVQSCCMKLWTETQSRALLHCSVAELNASLFNRFFAILPLCFRSRYFQCPSSTSAWKKLAAIDEGIERGRNIFT